LSLLRIRATARFDRCVKKKEPRGCLRVAVDAGGRALTAIAVHLGLSRAERHQQVAGLLDGGACDGDARALVVGGDFNDFPTRATRRLLDRKFVDAAHESRDRRATFPSRLPLLRLDRLYARGGIKLRGYNVVRSRLHRVASDHLPVVAEYEIEETAA
jgi:endonuclease/exonuclease/phosphatase family metal-dependent hydrolase